MTARRHDGRSADGPAATGRRGRVLRRTGVAVVAALAVVGALGLGQFFFGAPGVGHFRSIDGRAAYLDAYDRALSTLPPPTVTHDVTTGFGIVRVYEWNSPAVGDTVPVVLVPGRASGVPMWAENLPGIVPHHRVLAFDALGDAGRSVQGVPLTSTADQAQWIAEVLAVLAPDGAHVVGHSFGGASAAAYAQHHPGSVRSLVLLEPVFTFAYPPAGMLAWTMVAGLPFLPDRWRDTALGKVGGAEFDPTDAVAQMIAAGTEHYAASLPTPAPLADDRLAALTMPTYVAIAARDSIAGGERAAERARQLPDAVVEIFPDTTHSLPMQAAARLAAELPEFWRAAEQD